MNAPLYYVSSVTFFLLLKTIEVLYVTGVNKTKRLYKI